MECEYRSFFIIKLIIHCSNFINIIKIIYLFWLLPFSIFLPCFVSLIEFLHLHFFLLLHFFDCYKSFLNIFFFLYGSLSFIEWTILKKLKHSFPTVCSSRNFVKRRLIIFISNEYSNVSNMLFFWLIYERFYSEILSKYLTELNVGIYSILIIILIFKGIFAKIIIWG